jgi:CubicO group peptidase (beta-lactamase class C family)
VTRANSAARARLIAAASVSAAAVAVAAVLLGVAPVRAAPHATDPLDALMRDALNEQRIPGATLLVARAGRIVRAQGYGLANVELHVPATPATVFQSGSLGKQFTATAVMMLAEEGRLQLDDPLSRYFPEAPAAWRATGPTPISAI